jgi:glycosyltransferase involved in cell wall biosynthesis
VSQPSEGKQIAFYIRNLDVGGIQRIVTALANCMIGRGYHVDIVLANKEGPLRKEVREEVRVLNLDRSSALRSLPGFVRYAKQERPDAVVSMDDSINILLPWVCALFSLDTKVVLSVQNNISEYSEDEGVWYSGALPYLVSASYPFADEIITASEGVRDDLYETSNVRKKNVRVIHNPVVSNEMHKKRSLRCPHSWLRDAQEPVIIGVGRLSLQKNFSLLIRSFARVSTSIDARLVILGDGMERSRLENLIRKLGLQDRVDLPGFVDNPFPYYEEASLFVLSSVYEGFGNVIVEALACGCPVVSTDCPSGPQEILEGGKWGRLVPVNDVEALAEAMRATLADPPDPEPLRRRADAFSVEAAVEAYERVLFPDRSSDSSSRTSVSVRSSPTS